MRRSLRINEGFIKRYGIFGASIVTTQSCMVFNNNANSTGFSIVSTYPTGPCHHPLWSDMKFVPNFFTSVTMDGARGLIALSPPAVWIFSNFFVFFFIILKNLEGSYCVLPVSCYNKKYSYYFLMIYNLKPNILGYYYCLVARESMWVISTVIRMYYSIIYRYL